jgi:peptidoglycan/LPS O-acetylase OafA/YrhL
MITFTCATIVLASTRMVALYNPSADPLRVYYGTERRAAGFLVGALLAMIWSSFQESLSSKRWASEGVEWIDRSDYPL